MSRSLSCHGLNCFESESCQVWLYTVHQQATSPSLFPCSALILSKCSPFEASIAAVLVSVDISFLMGCCSLVADFQALPGGSVGAPLQKPGLRKPTLQSSCWQMCGSHQRLHWARHLCRPADRRAEGSDGEKPGRTSSCRSVTGSNAVHFSQSL